MRHISCVILSTLLVASGCRKQAVQNQATAAGSSTTSAGVSKGPVENAATKDVNILLPLERPSFVTNVLIGTGVNSDGSMTNSATEFPAGAPVWVSMKLNNPPKESVGQLIWLDSTGKRLASERKEVPPNAQYLSFRSLDTSSWKPGQYKVEAWMGGDKADEKTFAIEGKKSTKKSSKK